MLHSDQATSAVAWLQPIAISTSARTTTSLYRHIQHHLTGRNKRSFSGPHKLYGVDCLTEGPSHTSNTVKWISKHIEYMLVMCQIPQEWKGALICPFFFNWKKTDCSNCRSISLLNVAYKTHAKIKTRCPIAVTKVLLNEEKHIFSNGRSCSDSIFVLYQII
jgi:hypothetical protein